MTETTVLPEGSLARLTTKAIDLCRDSQGNARAYRVGDIFQVEDFVSAEESEDGVAFYWGSRNGGFNNVAVRADAVELHKTRSQISRLPAIQALLDTLSVAMMTDGEGFDIDETESDGESSIMAYGRTDDGFRFGVRISISNLIPTDF